MPIDLATKFQPYTDEQFPTERKKALLTNQDFDWTEAHTVKIYKITTSAMNDSAKVPLRATGAAMGPWPPWTTRGARD